MDKERVMTTKHIHEVKIGDRIDGKFVVGNCISGKPGLSYIVTFSDDDGNWYEVPYSFTAQVEVDDDCWSPPESSPEPDRDELVWHSIDDDPPLEDGRYLVCSEQAIYTIIAHACICEPPLPPIWSRLTEKGMHIRINGAYWWTEIPLPPSESAGEP